MTTTHFTTDNEPPERRTVRPHRAGMPERMPQVVMDGHRFDMCDIPTAQLVPGSTPPLLSALPPEPTPIRAGARELPGMPLLEPQIVSVDQSCGTIRYNLGTATIPDGRFVGSTLVLHLELRPDGGGDLLLIDLSSQVPRPRLRVALTFQQLALGYVSGMDARTTGMKLLIDPTWQPPEGA